MSVRCAGTFVQKDFLHKDFPQSMSRHNKPLASLQPAPRYANDATGFWGSVEAANESMGLSSLLPGGTVVQSDTAVKSRLLSAQIEWTPIQVRWKGCVFAASMSDAQFFLALESGGDTQQGRLVVTINKLLFNTGFPGYNDTFEVQSSGKWHQFVIAELIGQHDDNEPALVLYLEKDQNDTGE